MKVAVDKKLCIGCGLCSQLSPTIFKKVGEKAAVIAKNPDAATFAEAKKTAAQCPEKAISVK